MLQLVSVVTLSYKNIDSLKKTIDSVLSQDYPNIEYIISDDGSFEFPKKEIEEYIENKKKKNILKFLVLTSATNQGTVRNLNKAYKVATGEYIVPLSCNDVFFAPDVLSRIAYFFDNHDNDILVTSRVVYNASGYPISFIPSKKNIKKIEQLNTPYLQHEAFITNEFYEMASGCVLSVRKNFIKDWGYFDESYFLWEDGPFFTKYTKEKLITHDYSIVSIVYDQSGVSNTGANPLLVKDYVYYNRNERCKDIINYGYMTKQKIRYIQKRDYIKNKIELLLLYIRFPLVMLSKVIYRISSSK